ncbi:MAG: hypothetical protein WC894_04855 [Patescibacteria group bacterium]
MESRKKENYISNSLIGIQIQNRDDKWKRREIATLKDFRQKQKIQALPTNTRDNVQLVDLTSHEIAFYTGLAKSCVAVIVFDTVQKTAGASHYQTLTAFNLDELSKDDNYKHVEKQKFLDEINLEITAKLVSSASRRATITEAVADAIKEYKKVSNSTIGENTKMMIAGIAYASDEEAYELTQFTQELISNTGIQLVDSQLGTENGVYISLNHKILNGYGFYNSETNQIIKIGDF